MHNGGQGSHIDIPFWGRFHYSRAEVIADGVVHAVGIVLAGEPSRLALAAISGSLKRIRRAWLWSAGSTAP